MDIDNGIVKALFYDYPVDALIQQLDNLKNNQELDSFLDILPQLMQWSKQEYTFTEANLLRIQVGGEWKGARPTIYGIFNIFKRVTEILLTLEKDKPVIRYNQLFRWRDLIAYIGEDLLTSTFLALCDIDKTTPRSLFLWDDILPHNNHQLNEVLQKGLMELHAHYYATTDIFELNWLCLMNKVRLGKRMLQRIQTSQELELMSSQAESPISLFQQSVAAAYLRFVLFQVVFSRRESKGDQSDETSIESDFQERVMKILKDKWYADSFCSPLQASISWALNSSFPTTEGKHLDYCLRYKPKFGELLLKNNRNNACLIYQGERELLYSFFLGYFRGESRYIQLAPYMYLYLLLKNKICREFVQVNPIKGFENFEKYQDRKDCLIPETSPLITHYSYFVRNTSVSSLEHDKMEVRVSPKDVQKESFANETPLFADPTMLDPMGLIAPKSHLESNPLDIVVHFIKKGNYSYKMPSTMDTIGRIKDGTRDEFFRLELREQINKILLVSRTKRIVGIDAASSELFCRPETFGHVYRYARKKGIQGRTFHVGEDFLDLPDGLRAIDEAILFLDYDENCRLGHALALGLDVAQYYKRRHYTTTITKQYLLDDCVWLLMRGSELNISISPSFRLELEEQAMRFFNEIGYRKSWDIQSYWHSMLLRGNDPYYLDASKDIILKDDWSKTAISNNSRIRVAHMDETARALFYDYFYNKELINNGMKTIQHKWNKEIVRVVIQIQDKMQREISDRGISIECCPTSNLKISFIDQYCQHPLLTKFYPPCKEASYPLIKSSVNTDDRGVFYTSLQREYSLIALALTKLRDETTGERIYNDRAILKYMEELRQNAHQMAFRRYYDEEAANTAFKA